MKNNCGCAEQLDTAASNAQGQAAEKAVTGTQSNSGAEAVVVYFFQLAMLIVPQGYGELAIKTDAILISVGKLCSVEQPPGD